MEHAGVKLVGLHKPDRGHVRVVDELASVHGPKREHVFVADELEIAVNCRACKRYRAQVGVGYCTDGDYSVKSEVAE